MNILARAIIFQFMKRAEIERLLFHCTNYTYIERISNIVLKMGEKIILYRIQNGVRSEAKRLTSNSETFSETNDTRTHS